VHSTYQQHDINRHHQDFLIADIAQPPMPVEIG